MKVPQSARLGAVAVSTVALVSLGLASPAYASSGTVQCTTSKVVGMCGSM